MIPIVYGNSVERAMNMAKRRVFRSLQIGTVTDYKHLWLLIIWGIYLLFFVLAEHLVTDHYWISQLPIDQKIPFLEVFILPYCTWHPLLAVMTVYLAFYDADTFRKFMFSIALGFFPVLIFGLIFPNGQDLRPEYFERSNVFTYLVGLIYAADTNTNVLPSMHVIGCADMIAASFCCQKLRSRNLHLVMLLLGILISASTVFVKQHSLLDLLTAIPYSLLILSIIYRPDRKYA